MFGATGAIAMGSQACSSQSDQAKCRRTRGRYDDCTRLGRVINLRCVRVARRRYSTRCRVVENGHVGVDTKRPRVV